MSEPDQHGLTSAERLHAALVGVEADERFTEAVLRLRDGSRLCFCHRVGERWAKAIGPEQNEADGGLAAELLTGITMFRLNARHLDIRFQDSSRWEERVPARKSSGRNSGPG